MSNNELTNHIETVEEYLARGGKITICPTKTNDDIISDLRSVYEGLIRQIDIRAGRINRRDRA